ncbi:uncharacterized protein N7484_004582 [Penicillium longicatenatum]|uniref:uncharacterized protein n=1 Tax=Penicillium longicatenatum TaxID=1561947 RepID=UPI002546FCBF|nr:uncharacterized protein N7484_004582 [Penicillium longicatenatum]KAJ5650859.1 hypothetical protein N7484_004582 [Penicillium longicatenatum]
MNGYKVSQPNPRKRRRPALACEQCRRRKVRCDREMPCGPCIKSHPSLNCAYVDEGKAALDARLESSRFSEHDLSSHSDEQHVSSGAGRSSADRARIAQLERSIKALQNRVHDLEQNKAHGSQDHHQDEDTQQLSGEVDRVTGRLRGSEQPQTFISPLAPRIKSDNGRTKLFGTTHWALVFQQFRVLRQVRSTASYTDSEHNSISKSLTDIRKLRYRIKSRQAPQLVDPAPGLLSDLPPREICDQLVQHYLRTLGMIYRILHVPTFNQEFESFWEDPQSASRGFLLKLLLILAIGSVFHCKPGPLNELGMPIQRWVYAAQWWLSGPFSKEIGNLEGLQVYCLLLICRQTYAMDKESNWMSAGALLRQAVGQGLHRDPCNFPTISIFDGEMRRRIWATIIELNIQLAIDAAMPPLLAETDYDTRPPANIDDEDIDPSTTILPPIQLQDFFTDSSLQILLLRSFPIRLQVARTINECGREQLYETALQLGSVLTSACKEMAALFRTYTTSTRRSKNRPTQFHYQLMDTLLRRFLLNLYRPFTIQAAKDPRFYLARKLSLDSALMMASYGEMPEGLADTDQQPHQDFQRLALSGSGLFKAHLSLDVMIVISSELITQLEEEFGAHPEGIPPFTSSAVDQIANAARFPLIQALERIKGHLYTGLEAGIPSMKRYCLLAGVLAQVQPVSRQEQGDWPHIREAFMVSMQTCRTLLEQHISESQVTEEGALQTAMGESSIWTPESTFGSSLGSDFMFTDLGLDALNFWDLPSFVDGSAFDPPRAAFDV